MKFCTQCGTQLGDEAKFCSSCGEKIPAISQSSVCSNNSQNAPQNGFITKKCMACGKEYSDDYAVCPDCGISLGPQKNKLATGMGSAPLIVTAILSALIIYVALFAPVLSVGSWISISFYDLICDYGMEAVDSTVTWVGLAAIVPAIFVFVGSINKNKKMCVVSSAIASVAMLLLLFIMVSAFGDSLLGDFLGLDYLFGEDSPIGFGFWGPWIGHIFVTIYCFVFYNSTTVMLDRNAVLRYVVIALNWICILDVCFVPMAIIPTTEETYYLHGETIINLTSALELIQNEGMNAFFQYEGTGTIILTLFAALVIFVASLLRYYGLGMFVSLTTNVLLLEHFFVGSQNKSLAAGFWIAWIAHFVILICFFLIRDEKKDNKI